MARAKLTSARQNAGDEHVDRISGRAAIVVLILVGLVFYQIQTILIPFVLAAATAYAAAPLVDWLSRRGGVRRWLAATFVFLVLATSVGLLAWLGVPPLVRATALLANDLHGTVRTAAQDIIGDGTIVLFGQSLNAEMIAGRAVEIVTHWLGQRDNVLSLVATSGMIFVGAILTAVVLFYFLISGPQIGAGLLWLVPPRQRPFVEYLWTRVDPALKRYFVGLAIIVAYSTIAAYVGLGLVLGLRHALLLALMTGLCEIVAFVGPITAAIVAGLAALAQATNVGTVIGFAVYAVLLRVSIDQLLAPIVLGRAGRIHPTTVIFAMAVGGILFGFAGIILAVPTALSMKVVLEAIYDGPARPLSDS
jgi:predicted PurR-regulated permease PerM